MADPMSVVQRTHNIQPALNISDVIDIIGQDEPDYATSNMSVYGGLQMGGCAGGTQSEANYSTVSTTSRADPELDAKRKAYVRIIEQPQAKALRFRYICEGRSAGSIPGVRSTAENKTYPSIQLMGYKGPAVVVVSCVTVDPPYRPHPHNLVGKEGCKKGVCTMTINNDSMQCLFSNLGIQCVKKRDVEDALKLREDIRVDPFQTGFAHRNQPQSIDLNALRLCFQVFLEGSEKGKFTFPLKPVVSDPIYDKKATSDLIICKLSDCTSSVAGGKEIILLCDKVTKEDIHVRFYEVKDGMIEWEAFGDFQASDVHKQVAISFKTPRYKSLEVENSVKVFVQLLRPSDKSTSEPRPFEYLPLDSGRPFTSFKRLKNNYGLFQRILGLDSPVAGTVGGEDNLRHKIPSQAPCSPINIEDTKPAPLPEPKLSNQAPTAVVARPPSAASPPLLSQPRSSSSPPLAPNVTVINPSTSPPLLMSPDQSVDDIKQRLTLSLEKRKAGGSSPKVMSGPPKPSPFWSDDASVYSDTDILDDVLSQGSVNDLLSAVGDGFAVYEDITGLPDSTSSNALAPDAVYGDPSYASCYSNLEFVMGQARAAAASTLPSTDTNSNTKMEEVPSLPPKKNVRGSIVQTIDDDYGVYGTPSNQPIHPNKAALLLERGFRIGGSVPAAVATNQSPPTNHNIDSGLYYEPGNLQAPMGSASECDDLEDLWDDGPPQTQERTCEQLPRTVLDLFV